VKQDRVVALSLRPDYHIAAGLSSTEPAEIAVGSSEDVVDGNIIVPGRGRRALHPHWLRHSPQEIIVFSYCKTVIGGSLIPILHLQSSFLIAFRFTYADAERLA
jgi:hypothetical protein